MYAEGEGVHSTVFHIQNAYKGEGGGQNSNIYQCVLKWMVPNYFHSEHGRAASDILHISPDILYISFMSPGQKLLYGCDRWVSDVLDTICTVS